MICYFIYSRNPNDVFGPDMEGTIVSIHWIEFLSKTIPNGKYAYQMDIYLREDLFATVKNQSLSGILKMKVCTIVSSSSSVICDELLISDHKLRSPMLTV